jgi:hypothetical protein
MASHFLETLRPILALVNSGGSGQPPAHHHESLGWSVFVLSALVAYGWRCYAESDDRRVLIYKWVASVGLAILALLLLFLGRSEPKLLLLFIIPLPVLAFIWLPNLIGMLLRPLTGAFEGGYDEVEAKPFYFIAAAKRMKGLHQEAITEIRNQLEKFPGDVAGLMLLATIQAEDLRDLTAAQATIDELLQQAELKPQEIATALHTLADWQLQHGQGAETARATLERIAFALPGSQFSHSAEQRIAHLEDVVATREFREHAKFTIKPGERDVGLRNIPKSSSAEDTPQEMAAQYVAQLEKHPTDTDTREKLAILYAEGFGRLDLATDQLEQLIALPEETPKHVARWLNLLATLNIGIAKDEAGARIALQRIIGKFPKSALAEVATLRLGNLRNEMKSAAVTASKTLGNYEKNLGLKP